MVGGWWAQAGRQAGSAEGAVVVVMMVVAVVMCVGGKAQVWCEQVRRLPRNEAADHHSRPV